jgi:type I restriction enzyme R subunit
MPPLEHQLEESTNTGALIRHLLSTDYADNVFATTIQNRGLALDENSKGNKHRTRYVQSSVLLSLN